MSDRLDLLVDHLRVHPHHHLELLDLEVVLDLGRTPPFQTMVVQELGEDWPPSRR